MTNPLSVRRVSVLVSVLVAGLGLACSKTGSQNVKTTGMYVSFTIEGNNQNAAVCRAQFQVGGATGTFLELEGGDSVTCQGQAMSKSEFAGIVTYSAAVAYNPGGTYAVNLSRPDEPLYSSTVVLPAAIAGMTPSSFQSYVKGQAFAAAWTPSANGLDRMTVGLSFDAGNASYYRSKSGGQPELGIVGFGAEDTVATPPVAGSYAGSLSYERARSGSVSASLSGTITAVQSFDVPIELRD